MNELGELAWPKFLAELPTEAIRMESIPDKVLRAWNTVAGPSESTRPIQLAMSSMLGAVADTSANRTSEPSDFMRDITTSKVLPRASFKI